MSRPPRPKLSKSALKQPDENTRFHIDYSWWEESGLDLKAYVYSRLPAGDEINLDPDLSEVDLIDTVTGEVHQVDGFEYLLQTQFSQLSEAFMARTPLAEAVFYILLANANQPMTAAEIGERVHRSPDVVLRTLAGPKVYKGIRPIYADE